MIRGKLGATGWFIRVLSARRSRNVAKLSFSPRPCRVPGASVHLSLKSLSSYRTKVKHWLAVFMLLTACSPFSSCPKLCFWGKLQANMRLQKVKGMAHIGRRASWAWVKVDNKTLVAVVRAIVTVSWSFCGKRGKNVPKCVFYEYSTDQADFKQKFSSSTI